MSRAQQLPLTLSVADSVTVQLDRDRATWYAREQHDRAEALSAENVRLREENATRQKALQAEQARALKLEDDLRLTQLLVECLEAQVALLQRAREQAPRGARDKDMLTRLLTLAHPDKWSQGQPATELAHEIAVVVNELRSSRLGVG